MKSRSALFVPQSNQRIDLSGTTRRSIARQELHPFSQTRPGASCPLLDSTAARIFSLRSSLHRCNKRRVFFCLPGYETHRRAYAARTLGDYRKYLSGISRSPNMYWTVFPFETMLSSKLRMRCICLFAGCQLFMILALNSKSVEGLRL